jgi:hypothetical protein
VQCLTGSQSQTGVPAYFYYADSDIQAFALPAFGFITQAMMGLPFGPQRTADFCANEPTGDLPTSADYLALWNPFVSAVDGAYQRFGNQVKADKFSAFCECTGTPAPGTPCTTFSGNYSAAEPGCAGGGCPFGSCVYWGCTAVQSYQHFPAGQHGLTVTVTFPSPVKFGAYSSPSGTTLYSNATPQATHTFTANAPLADTVWQGYENGLGTGWAITYSIGYFPAPMEAPCSSYPFNGPPPLTNPAGWPALPPAPTCGTTQDVCNSLQTILTRLNVIDAELNLSQRFAAPFAYTLGTAHAGLTGSGVISAQAMIGCLVTRTTGRPGAGQTGDNPPRSVPAWAVIQPATIDGVHHWTDVHYSPEMVTFWPNWWDRFDYTIHPGYVAAITPLLAPK